MITVNSLGQLVVTQADSLPDFGAMTFPQQEALIKKWVAAGAIPAAEEDWYFGMISMPPEDWTAADRAKFVAAVKAYRSGKRLPIWVFPAAAAVVGVAVMFWMAVTGK